MILVGFGCESNDDRQQREFKQEFGNIVRTYRERIHDPPQAEAPSVLADELPPLAGRKILRLVKHKRHFNVPVHQEPAYKALHAPTPDSVGVLLYVTTTHETEPTVRYDDGPVGFQGTTVYTAVAHPEGIVIAEGTVPCELPTEVSKNGFEYWCRPQEKELAKSLEHLLAESAEGKH